MYLMGVCDYWGSRLRRCIGKCVHLHSVEETVFYDDDYIFRLEENGILCGAAVARQRAQTLIRSITRRTCGVQHSRMPARTQSIGSPREVLLPPISPFCFGRPPVWWSHSCWSPAPFLPSPSLPVYCVPTGSVQNVLFIGSSQTEKTSYCFHPKEMF